MERPGRHGPQWSALAMALVILVTGTAAIVSAQFVTAVGVGLSGVGTAVLAIAALTHGRPR
jgi:hypothetical protein